MKKLAAYALTVIAAFVFGLMYPGNGKAQSGSHSYTIQQDGLTVTGGMEVQASGKAIAISCTEKHCYVLMEH